ncbi:MAG: four helix bundle protein [Acidobacteria bacterium]|nr:MAG: four helix bundle protein [Acidobacteriota bacterium]
MTENEFKARTKQVALRVIRLVNTLPMSGVSGVVGKQLVRSGTSIGANYRAACRGKSTADVLHKLAIVEEEADESLYWIELLIEAQIVSERKLASLTKEINEIVRMIVASIKTLRFKGQNVPRNSSNPKSKIQNPK